MKHASSLYRRVAATGISWDTQKEIREICRENGLEYVGKDYGRMSILVIPDWHCEDIEVVRNARESGITILTLENFRLTYKKRPSRPELAAPAVTYCVAVSDLSYARQSVVVEACRRQGFTYLGQSYSQMSMLVISDWRVGNSKIALAQRKGIPILLFEEFVKKYG